MFLDDSVFYLFFSLLVIPLNFYPLFARSMNKQHLSEFAACIWMTVYESSQI